MADKTSRYYNFNVDDYKVESGIMDVSKPKSFYISLPLWVSVDLDNDFNESMKELEVKLKWEFRRTLREHFTSIGYNRSIIVLDTPIEINSRIGTKNTYVNLEITVFVDNNIDFDTVKVKGINQLVFTYGEHCINFIRNIGNGLSFYPTKK
jgi:hypothetical protein